MSRSYVLRPILYAVAVVLPGCSQQGDIDKQLNQAAMKGDTRLAGRLLDKGANINARDKQYNATPLMWAAHEGHPKTLKLLLERGAEIEAEKEGGKTALWYAAKQGRGGTARLLIQRGANPNAKTGDGITALMVAKSKGHTAVVELLRQAAPPPGGITLRISDDKFTINGSKTFLLGVSYFDALSWKTSDLDELARRGYNLIRIWLDWAIWNDRSRSFFNSDGNLIHEQTLLNLVRAAAARGLVVDVTILNDTKESGAGNPENAVRNAVRALRDEPNVFFDLVNEHGWRGWALDSSRMRSLVNIARQEDSNAIITLSTCCGHYDNGVDVDLDIGVDLLAPHLNRTSDWFEQTDERVVELKSETGRPIYLQEEQRRGWRGANPTKGHFLQALREALNAGAAGWVFHTDAGFDLSSSTFFDNLDPVERETVDDLPEIVGAASTSTSHTSVM